MTRSISTSTLMAGCLTAIFPCGTASADLVVTDPDNRVTLTVSSAPSPSPVSATHTTYIFSLEALQASDAITGIDATFLADTPGTMRQYNPLGQPTIFEDNNAFFFIDSEDPLGDSQFEFSSAGVTVAPGTAMESTSVLSAAFVGFPGIQVSQSIAHVVLQNGTTGAFDLELSVRPIGGTVGDLVIFSGISFGATAIPEVSPVLALPCLGILLAIPSYVASKRRRAADKQSTES